MAVRCLSAQLILQLRRCPHCHPGRSRTINKNQFSKGILLPHTDTDSEATEKPHNVLSAFLRCYEQKSSDSVYAHDVKSRIDWPKMHKSEGNKEHRSGCSCPFRYKQLRITTLMEPGIIVDNSAPCGPTGHGQRTYCIHPPGKDYHAASCQRDLLEAASVRDPKRNPIGLLVQTESKMLYFHVAMHYSSTSQLCPTAIRELMSSVIQSWRTLI